MAELKEDFIKNPENSLLPYQSKQSKITQCKSTENDRIGKNAKKKKIRAEQINCGAEEIEKTVYAVKNLKLQ